MESAPFRADLAEGPEDVRAVWRCGRDGIRIRVVLWPVDGAQGSILLFPGRTEYAEKYGRVARDLNGAGYAVATVDWRGQGFSDRLTDDARLGHVASFPDYQIDVAELVSTARADGLPEPWFLVAHSMGGCIGLRSLIEGLPVRKAIFSAPMWGLNLPFTVWPAAILLARLLGFLGVERRYIPGSGPGSYVTEAGFGSNVLTRDRETFTHMARQLTEEPGLVLGGPSIGWVGSAISEQRRLAGAPRPDLPVLTILGSDERVVSASAVRRMHARWPSARLHVIDGARHEVMMEVPAIRARFMRDALQFLEGNRTADAAGLGAAAAAS